ncbi:hypothetical protein C6341_g16470 [Phytophthora cactorum]|nr:hypothetical protein C6341_g16470 [Phytophthora cactorum]
MLIEYMKQHQRDWLMEYLSTKKCEDRGQKTSASCAKNLQSDKLSQLALSLDFWGSHWNTPLTEIYNVDETSIYYAMAPKNGWAGKGKTDSRRVTGLTKHQGRMTAVITVRDDEKHF